MIFVAGIVLDLLSVLAWARPALVAPIAALLVLAIAVAAFRDIRAGVAVVLLELLWGSHGRLVAVSIGGVSWSLRMGIFVAVCAATAWHLRHSAVRQQLWAALRSHPARWPALVWGGTVVVALAVGAMRHAPGAVFQDGNAWAFLALTPAFLLALGCTQRHASGDGGDRGRWLSCVLLTGALYLIARTYALLFLFTHNLGGFWLALYQWVRDTRLGEITVFPGGFPRIFLPSMVWLFPALLLAAERIAHASPRNDKEVSRRGISPHAAVFGGSIAVLLVSLSRSFWVGLAALGGVAFLVVFLARLPSVCLSNVLAKHSWRILFDTHIAWRVMVRGGGAVIGALLIAMALVKLPYPAPLTTAGFGATFAARFQQDEAVGNRWQQIAPLTEAILRHPILGSGFGAAVTYHSKDPRTLAAFPDGNFTTMAFEWGFLDDLLERGILGLAAEFWLLGALILYGLRRTHRVPFLPALSLALLAFVLIHTTSPYLNHPLGLGLVMVMFAGIATPYGGTKTIAA
ncbi:MAG: O-antigen ligase family protein [bacterium]|nr:O-antigen ligase family protein [bacterium]